MNRILKSILCAIALVQVLGFFVIPSLRSHRFLSPDETAVAAVAERIVTARSFEWTNPKAEAFPWWRPRSFVNQPGGRMLPVGFLGMPLIAAVMFALMGLTGFWIVGPLTALLGAWMLWRITAKSELLVRVATVSVWCAFPTVLFYANRGLFPNLATVALMLAVVVLIREARSKIGLIGAGIIFGIALAIRPVELPWMLAWVIGAVALRWDAEGRPFAVTLRGGRPSRGEELGWMLIGIVPIMLLIGVLHTQIYGAPWLAGYALRDPVWVLDQAGAQAIAPVQSWPFGIHPRVMWFHVTQYLMGVLWPWMVSVGLAAVCWYQARTRRWQDWLIWFVGAWTLFVVFLMYGSIPAHDVVGLNRVTIGNSFLRYALPLAPFICLAVGRFVKEMLYASKRWQLLTVIWVIFLVGFGTWTALWRYEDSIVPSRGELVNYAWWQQETISRVPKGTVIVSERSDKIFFQIIAPSVSPVPPTEELIRMLQSGIPVAYFGTTETDTGVVRWRAQGILLFPVATKGNQTLYLLRYEL